jgi:hypothetical protein
MTDGKTTEHLHDLTDDEWKALEGTDEAGPAIANAEQSLCAKGLAAFDSSSDRILPTPAGQAVLDRVRELAQELTLDEAFQLKRFPLGDGWITASEECTMDYLERERLILGDEALPLGRAVLRQWGVNRED